MRNKKTNQLEPILTYPANSFFISTGQPSRSEAVLAKFQSSGIRFSTSSLVAMRWTDIADAHDLGTS